MSGGRKRGGTGGGEEKGREKGERNERIEKDLARGPEGSH